MIIDPSADGIDGYFEEQRYYSWKEILGLLDECGIKNVNSLKDFDGNIAREGKEAKIFMGEKD